jgi:hypothetical protein
MLTRPAGAALLACMLALLPTGVRGDPRDLFWAGIRRIGIVLESIVKLGEGGADSGAIWIAEPGGGPPRAVTTEAGYAWPVLNARGDTIFALRGERAVRIDAATGTASPLPAGPPLRKLVGATPDGTVLAIAVDGPFGRPALIASDGKIALLPAPEDEAQRRHLAVLLSESRVYDGGRRLTVDRSSRSRRGFDVFLDGRNVSDCGSDACGQPALSADGRRVVFIRDARP